MRASELMQAMLDAGAPIEAAMIALRELEAREAELEQRRAGDRERKRRQRAKSSDGDVTVPGQSRDSHRDIPATPSLSPSPLPSPQTPQLTPRPHTHPDNTTRARKPDDFPCPDGVDPVDWDALKANRKAKRAALSEGAHRQIVRKLDAWQREGWPPGPVVACAAERGWITVFQTDEMKDRQNGKNVRAGGNGSDRRSSLARAIDDGIEWLDGAAQAGVS